LCIDPYKNKKDFYLTSGTVFGTDSSRSDYPLLIYSGTFLTDYSQSFLSRVLVSKERQEKERKMRIRVQNGIYSKIDTVNRFFVKNIDSFSVYLFSIQETFFSPISNERRVPFSWIIISIMKVNKKDYAVEEYFVKKSAVIDSVERSSFRYEVYKKSGTKYYQDTLYYLHTRVFKKQGAQRDYATDLKGLIVKTNKLIPNTVNTNTLKRINNIQPDLGNIQPYYFNNFCEPVLDLTDEMKTEWKIQSEKINRLEQKADALLLLLDVDKK
jgi:hypothetical protein